jgi:hypothetical protein
MENSIKIMEKILFVKKDSLGVEQYNALWHGYQLLKEQFPKLSQEEFKQEIAYLRGQRYINVEDIRENANGILDGRIIATEPGAEYYIENKDKDKIGF